MQLHFHLLFAGNLYELFDDSNDVLNFLMTEHNRFQHDLFGYFVRFGLYHHNRIFRTGDDDINVAGFLLGNIRINDELAIDAADGYPANRSVKRHIRYAERCGCSDHRGDFRFTILIHTHDEIDDLDIVTEPFRKQRTNRTVRQAAGKDGLLTRPALPFNEAAWDFTHSVQFLFIVYGKRKEIQILRLRRGGNCTQNGGIPVAYHNGCVRLLGQAACFQYKRSSSQLHFHMILHEIPPYHK
ncbi:hypothetical protein D3C77_436820 [compost metagenome]